MVGRRFKFSLSLKGDKLQCHACFEEDTKWVLLEVPATNITPGTIASAHVLAVHIEVDIKGVSHGIHTAKQGIN